MIQFEVFPKIDAHFHVFSDVSVYLDIAKKISLQYININTDTHIFPLMSEQESISRMYSEKYPEFFSYISSFSMNGWEEEGWMDKVLHQIETSMQNGALGIKLWKNIGMEIIKSDGTYLMIDDPFFYPLFQYLSDNHITVVAHLGEPRNCWLPIEQMTTERNKAYFSTYPQYHAFLHPEIPSYEQQIQARDNVLSLFPDLIFVGAHFGSLEWSVDELALRLDKYPNFMVDVSSRMGHIQLQAQTAYEKVRDFFLSYSDRIIYGTDAYNNLQKLQTSLYNDWRFLTTYDVCNSSDILGTFRGLYLPEDVLLRIYHDNARRCFLSYPL